MSIVGRILSLATLAAVLVGCAARAPTPRTFAPVTPVPSTIAAPTRTATSATSSTPATNSTPATSMPTTGSESSLAAVVRATVRELWDGGRARYGSATIEVEGWLSTPWGVGGPGTGITPAWLGEWETDAVLWAAPLPTPPDCSAEGSCLFIFLHVPPGASVGALERRVRLTGHYDDARASDCRPSAGHPTMTPAHAVETCRDAFVVTRVVGVAPPP